MSQRQSTTTPVQSEVQLTWRRTTSLLVGLVILVMRVFESAIGVPGMPRSWHQNDALWYALGLISVGFGVRSLLLSEPRETAAFLWRPTIPGRRFRQMILYTRVNCPLCDEAVETLADYSQWLPQPQEINIDSDPQLVQKYTNCVPVVVCDGQVRFRGRIDEALLRRLIEGAPPLTSPEVRL